MDETQVRAQQFNAERMVEERRMFPGEVVEQPTKAEFDALAAEVRNLRWALTTIREQDTGAWPTFAGEMLRMSTEEATALRERWTRNAATT